MTIRELAREHVARELWGFAPGREVKPVHFANKFFRALCGQTGSPSLIHAATALRRPGRQHIPAGDFVREHPAHFERTEQVTVEDRVEEVRAALDLVFDQDKGVYPSNRTYSFTLTHYAFTSPDPSDQGTGRFLAQVLAATENGQAVEVMRSVLQDPSDPMTRLALPLLPDEPLGPSPGPDVLVGRLVERSVLLQHLQQAFERLVRHAETLEKTALLQRAVTLGAFGLVAHVLNATDEAAGGDLTPLLLCAPQPHTDVREASRASVNRALKNIHRAFEQQLARWLTNRSQADEDEMGYRRLMKDWLDTDGLGRRDAKKAEEAQVQFEKDFPLELAGAEDAFSAFLRAAVPAAFIVIGTNSPERFALALGRLCGLFFPRAQGRGEKYALPAANFYDMLVPALLEPGQEVSSNEFWELARAQFGLLCGANPYSDAERLTRRGIRLASEPSLEENAVGVATELQHLGHARRYADGFTLIRAAHEV